MGNEHRGTAPAQSEPAADPEARDGTRTVRASDPHLGGAIEFALSVASAAGTDAPAAPGDAASDAASDPGASPGDPAPNSQTFRTLFLSDFHLGTKNAKAELLLEFLDSHDAETIFLVGDIVDIWRLQKHPHWPGPHNDVLQALLRKARRGARLILIPGNHDEALREYCGQTFGPVSLELNAIHVTADGQRFVVMHGDEFDIVVCHAPWLAHFGDSAYNFALWLNSRFNSVRRTAGLGYWSLSAFLKRKVKQAVNFIGRYETTLAREAQRRDADGIICGHIHHAAMRRINGITYINTGDWVESCTAVVEHSSGVLELVYWGQRKPVSRWRRRRTSTAELVPAE